MDAHEAAVACAVGAHKPKTCESMKAVKSSASIQQGTHSLEIPGWREPHCEGENSGSSSAFSASLPNRLSNRLVRRARKAATMSLENEVDGDDACVKKREQSSSFAHFWNDGTGFPFNFSFEKCLNPGALFCSKAFTVG